MTPTSTATPISLASPGATGSDPTDAELVDLVRGGDDRAFEQLYGRYHRRIGAYVLGMVRDHGRSEDITQEVFLSALRRMRATDRPIVFKPWLYEIAKNACIDHFRRSRRSEEVSFDTTAGGEPDAPVLACRRGTPDVAVDDKLALDSLCGAFGELSDGHHQILVMRELEGLSYKEIGLRLGLSRAGVESTLFRARRRLAEEYQELVSGERCLRARSTIAATAAGSGGTGMREQRRLAAHVSRCPPCRRHAHAAGLDLGAVRRRRAAAARVAAFLPLPAVLRRRAGGDVPSGGDGGSLSGWAGTLSASVDPAVAAGWLKAATAAGAVAVVGVGAGHSQGRPDSGRTPGAAVRTVGSPAGPAARPPAPTLPGSRSASAGTGARRPATEGPAARTAGVVAPAGTASPGTPATGTPESSSTSPPAAAGPRAPLAGAQSGSGASTGDAARGGAGAVLAPPLATAQAAAQAAGLPAGSVPPPRPGRPAELPHPLRDAIGASGPAAAAVEQAPAAAAGVAGALTGRAPAPPATPSAPAGIVAPHPLP